MACFTLPAERRQVMCRPSCCDKSGGQGAGIAVVAIILLAALIVAKIGPVVAKIAHIAVELLRIAAETAAAVLAFAALAWLTVMIMRWWLRHRSAQRQASFRPVDTATWQNVQAGDPADCLACGGNGQVLRAIGSRFQPAECPVCEPARQAR